MKVITAKPPYFPFTEQKNLCVACAVQWILYRRGLKMVEQEKIGQALKFIAPLTSLVQPRGLN